MGSPELSDLRVLDASADVAVEFDDDLHDRLDHERLGRALHGGVA
jgi:hypothetical protein